MLLEDSPCCWGIVQKGEPGSVSTMPLKTVTPPGPRTPLGRVLSW